MNNKISVESKEMNEINNKQLEKQDLDVLEKVSGGQFLTPEDLAKAYEYVMLPIDWPCPIPICELVESNYEDELKRTDRKITYEEWRKQLDSYLENYARLHCQYMG